MGNRSVQAAALYTDIAMDRKPPEIDPQKRNGRQWAGRDTNP
jgi:hypothetical protein